MEARGVKLGTLVRDVLTDRAFCMVRRTSGDRGKRLPKARPGQMLFWRDRSRVLVTTKQGRLFAGLAQSEIKPGNSGLIQVYGPIIEAK